MTPTRLLEADPYELCWTTGCGRLSVKDGYCWACQPFNGPKMSDPFTEEAEKLEEDFGYDYGDYYEEEEEE